jgi:hypothetical protein
MIISAQGSVVFSRACADQTEPTPMPDADAASIEEHNGRWGGAGDVTVMTQNLYVGADVDAVITALATPDPDDDIPALLAAVATIKRTDFPARARAIAREIKRERPEVVASLGTASPAIVMGDFNAKPNSPAYQVMQGGGFTDVWGALRPGVRGYTCCQLADLSNPRPVYDERIDYVWTRGLGEDRGRQSLLGQVRLYGDVPSDRIKNTAGQWIWPSDHAGLIADIQLPRGGGHH